MTEPAAQPKGRALVDAIAEAAARRTVEILREEGLAGSANGGSLPELISAAQVARQCGRTREWVYDHADELGAIRLGDGPKKKPRLMFDPGKIAEALAPTGEPAPERPAKSRRRQRPAGELLPIRGKP